MLSSSNVQADTLGKRFHNNIEKPFPKYLIFYYGHVGLDYEF